VSRNNTSRTQTPNSEEKYDAYLASDGEPEDVTCNPLNLFEIINVVDRVWFSLAQNHLAQRRGNLYD
jgi:hypothetical protein